MALSLEDSKDWPDAKRIMRFARCAGVAPQRAAEILKACARGIAATLKQLERFAAKRPRHGKLAAAMRRHWRAGLETLGAAVIAGR